MKHLLNGVAIAAALALATPAFAQAPAPAAAPMTPSAPKAAAAPAAAAKPPAKQMHRPMRHMARHHHMMRMAPGDAMTEQLNREELARLQGGGMAPPPPPPGMMGPGEGPRPSGH